MTSRQLIWLLSGGIGSGKSTVRRMFEERGLATIDADSVGHQVIAPDGPAFDEVASAWPEVVLDGEIDRKRLAGIVFGDTAQLRRLEKITHPHIFSTLEERVAAHDEQAPLIIEIPVLRQPLEKPLPRIVVDAPDEIRVERSVARGHSEEDVRDRMSTQPSRAEWLAAADLVIPNTGTLDELEAAVDRVIATLFPH